MGVILDKITSSPKVRFAYVVGGRQMILTKDRKLAEDLASKGCSMREYDRTQYSTRAGKSKANFEFEINVQSLIDAEGK